MKKILIAYYSRRGQNYVSGNIVDLERGNTELLAQLIAEDLRARGCNPTLFHIDTLQPYPQDYTETTEVSRTEQVQKARPELNAHVENFSQYDTIILGYPNWWSSSPMAVHTFLEQYDFAGKHIVPFCTHEGSGLGHSVRDIAQLAPQAVVTQGFAVVGSQAPQAKSVANAIIEAALSATK